jgi:ABC-type sugar transport system ATPase subunit
MTSVELRDISLSLGPSTLFEAFNLKVESGELCAIMGPSGSGKSTILRLIAGLQQPDAGEILIGGQVVTHLTPQQRRVGFVFQSHGLYPHMTVRRNMAYGLEVERVPRRERVSRVEDMAERLGLRPLLDRRPHQLSGGQRQRVAIGRALVRGQRIILLDEPFSSLDGELRGALRSELAQLNASTRATMILVTHDVDDAAICRQVIEVKSPEARR